MVTFFYLYGEYQVSVTIFLFNLIPFAAESNAITFDHVKNVL